MENQQQIIKALEEITEAIENNSIHKNHSHTGLNLMDDISEIAYQLKRIADILEAQVK
jgi:hypothetical protein